MARRRGNLDWDYSILHRTGEKVAVFRNLDRIEAVTEDTMSAENGDVGSDLSNLIQNEEGIVDEVSDFFAENKLPDAYNLEEIDENVAEIKELRKNYKRIHRHLKELSTDYNTEFKMKYEKVCQQMSDYIIEAKAEKKTRCDNVEEQRAIDKEKEMTEQRRQEEAILKVKEAEEERICQIKNKEINEKIAQIKGMYSSIEFLEDDEVLDLKGSLNNVDRELRDLRDMRDKFESLISRFIKKESIMKDLAEKYKEISDAAIKYKEELKTEIKNRELEDYKLKATSKLVIQIPKFSGTDHKIDVYTFQTKFKEEHSRLPKNKCLYQLKEKFLIGPAKEMVKLIDDVDEIWKVLKDAFGDPKVLLNCELDSVRKLGSLSKIKDNQELALALSKLANAMENLNKTAKTHGIEYELFNSHTEGLIYEIMGDQRVDRFLEKCDSKGSCEDEWTMLIDFLRNEAKRKSRMALKLNSIGKPQERDKRDRNEKKDSKSMFSEKFDECDVNSSNCYQSEGIERHCKACKGSGCENKDEKTFEYVKCKEFRKMTPLERLAKIKKDKICFQCLKTKHSYKKDCTDNEFCCPNEYHQKFSKGYHVLVCQDHQDEEDNKKLLDKYKLKIFKGKANIPQNFFAVTRVHQAEEKKNVESAIYMFQRIKVDGQIYNVFYDNGCSDSIIKKTAVDRLGNKAVEEVPGPRKLYGVGDKVLETPHGIYKITLPLADGGEAVIVGVCLDKITHKFPNYEFDAAVRNDFMSFIKEKNINEYQIPQFPRKAGGETDIMIGVLFHKYFPLEVLRLPSGLSLFQSMFVGDDGTRGIICGPHSSFAKAEKHFEYQHVQVYNSRSILGIHSNPPFNQDLSLLGFKDSGDLLKDKFVGDQSYHGKISKNIKAHEAAEEAGTICDYRCIDCRECSKCKQGERIESISLREEYEQDLINKSVHVDIDKCEAVAVLPIVESCPENILKPNGEECLSMLKSLIKQIEKDPKSKEEIIEFEQKLQNLGFVDYVKNLPSEMKQFLQESLIQNFIPWHCVWNVNSFTTFCRMVFNASFSSKGRRNLNSILAKGVNSMNSLLEIVLRWSVHPVAYHADVQKMYNTILLDSSYWCYQRYWWKKDLDNKNPVEEKVIKTLIYGMRPSGNQAERALRLTASKMEGEYPKAAEVVKRDTYVDDLMSGNLSMFDAKEAAEEIQLLLLHGGFKLKGFTFSGKDPPVNLSEDEKSIMVAGMRWFSKDDVVKLSVGDLAFEKRKRGKVNLEKVGLIPEKFTRRQCHGKVGEIFDLTGKVAPIVAGMKMDLRNLRKLQWDDVIPENLRQIWVSNFEMMKEISDIRFQRCVIPKDAVSTDIETLEFGDSSNSIICAAVYVRLKRITGTYSCQLIFARTKLLPEDTSIPRGELSAAELNASTGFVVRKSLGTYSKDYSKFTDSQVALFWIHSRNKPLKQWVRGRVIEINRLSDCNNWSYIQSHNNVADIGTRKGAQIKDVDMNSVWRNGHPWMVLGENEFPTMTIDNINFKNIKDDVNTEMHKYAQTLEALEINSTEDTFVHISQTFTSRIVPKNVSERYKFCDYLIDPNKYRLRKVVRILSIVKRFIKNSKIAIQQRKETLSAEHDTACLKDVPSGLNENQEKDAIILSDSEVLSALEYFYRKSTLEIRKFRPKKCYEKISEEVNGILYYKGRILLEQNVTGIEDMCDVMVDLSCRTFWVPLVDRFSPFAYSIVNEVHWYSKEANHTGVEKILRYTMQYAHIIEGRELVKKIRKSCTKCRLLMKEQLKVIMGPVSKHNLNIAPAFYVTQVDLMGPLDSYHGTNKRSKMKIWVIVFCCCTTSAVSLNVMETYSSSSFILGFKRFSSRMGFPKILLPDHGSQLLKGCGDSCLNFKDIQGKLNKEYGIEFEPCPVGAHYMHGRVERKIRHIRESMTRSLEGQRLSTIGWETLCAEIANCINDLPIGLKNKNADLNNLDLLTPNRLILGRNNNRSPTEPVEVTAAHDRIIESNNNIYKQWFKCWLIEYVPSLMNQQKWFKDNKRSLQENDIILFKGKEKEIECSYKYGIIKGLVQSKDGIARTAIVEYQNAEENFKRTTKRGIRELILIQHVDEIGVMHELDEAERMSKSEENENK